MKLKFIWSSLVACIFFATPALSNEKNSLLITLNRLSMDAGYVIARAAIENCRKRGIQVAVTVTDRNGTVLIVMRDSITASIAVPISQQKAFTAVNFNVATSQLAQRGDSPLSNIDGLLMAAGGLPINVAGQLVGGIGVSGAPSGKTDEACAQAGIDSTKDDLELAM